ncbi:MAG: hypothetical protein GYA55_10705 [SAR324 cluster bacterium]|uniref:Uncharacterized protein n=1 Tax=SAR324 cluster bacterium TaxID=2024889 RepID=A0A7X9FSQ9_9DELT|nr:hypothetical protein [SAR324 cluster bacterium]
MEWTSPFIIYRMDSEGKLYEVFHARNIEQAKYWLSYIAEIGDVLTKSPAHPKNNTGKPQYWSHKEQSGSAVSSKQRWLKLYELSDFESVVPSEQINARIEG